MIDFLISIMWFVIGAFFTFTILSQIRQLLFFYPRLFVLYFKDRLKNTAILFSLATLISFLLIDIFVIWLIQDYVLYHLIAFILGGVFSGIIKFYLDLFNDEERLKNNADFLRYRLPHSKDELTELTNEFIGKFSTFVLKNLSSDDKRESVSRIIKFCPELLKPKLSEIRNELFKLQIDDSDWLDLRFAIEHNFHNKNSSTTNYQEIVEEIAYLYIKSHENISATTDAEIDLESMEDWAIKNRLYSQIIPSYWQKIDIELAKQNASGEVLSMWRQAKDIQMAAHLFMKN